MRRMTKDEMRAALEAVPVERRLAVLFALREDLSQRDVASRIGCSESHLSLIVAGRRRADAPTRKAISRVVGLPIGDLFGKAA